MSRSGQRTASLAELAELVGGTVVGDDNVRVQRVAPIHLAGEQDITFVSNPKYVSALTATRASAVILRPDLEYAGNVPQIVTADPYLAFAKVLTFLNVNAPVSAGIVATAHVAETATIAEGVTVSAGCYVGDNVQIGKGSYLHPGVVLLDNVVVGADCLLYPGVVVREECRIGDRVILQPNAVIGSDGFGFAPDGEGYFKIPQVGIVVIEDDVEIGACSCVDRAAMGQTLIKKGTKIDNLVQIGHNVEVGQNTIMVSHTAIAGSTVIGNHCVFGGQSGAVGHIKIGDNVTVVARGGVSTSVDSHQYLAGFPIMPHKDWLKVSSSINKLPELRKEVNRLSKKIEELENRMKES